ncbi:MAG: threonylcarbamoyl-AMP synthase [Desulfobacula sp.]|jgi:L-threonylcarbamoyladenylate synthase|nr:threonylcarbamoyl-AMP synthase [Desulfobacula sp.]
MSEPSNIIRINPDRPDKAAILKAADIIRNKGLVLIPTQCLYGIGACALKDETVKKVFQLKQRPPDNPVLILVPDSSFVQDIVTYIPKTAKLLMNAFWPGGLTIVYQANPNIPGSLTAGTDKIGIRVPSHPVAKALMDTLAFPITGTSANISGRPGCSRIDLLDPEIRTGADLILDAGMLKGGSGSTIVDVTVSPIRIIREGVVKKDEIFKALA